MAIIQNITIDQDCDFTETLTVKDSTGTVVDFVTMFPSLCQHSENKFQVLVHHSKHHNHN